MRPLHNYSLLRLSFLTLKRR